MRRSVSDGSARPPERERTQGPASRLSDRPPCSTLKEPVITAPAKVNQPPHFVLTCEASFIFQKAKKNDQLKAVSHSDLIPSELGHRSNAASQGSRALQGAWRGEGYPLMPQNVGKSLVQGTPGEIIKRKKGENCLHRESWIYFIYV